MRIIGSVPTIIGICTSGWLRRTALRTRSATACSLSTGSSIGNRVLTPVNMPVAM